ncbi:unnamed protein product [Discula destructiva]
MPRDSLDSHRNFLYGNQGQKPRRASLWGCKRGIAPPEVFSPRSPARAAQDSPTHNTTPNTSAEMPQQTSTPPSGDHRSHQRSDPREHAQAHHNTDRVVQQQQSEPLDHPHHYHQHHQVPGFPPYQPPPFTVHPFRHLATTVKQCPWMLGSDVNPFAPGSHPEFFPPAPRSLKHDTAVSFVVTDQTRPQQPQFVISCPLEHVDFISDMLAPAGSQRMLSARGSSGHPRDGAELRSMLLDGTPNIELALHCNVVAANEAGHHDSGGSGGGGGGGGGGDGSGSGNGSCASSAPDSRTHSWVRERPARPSPPDGSGYGDPPWGYAGGAPQSYGIPYVPVAPGYYQGSAGPRQ